MVDKPVALISMPTASVKYPSFELALLKPTLEQAGISVQNFSLFLYFGKHIGWTLNEALMQPRACMVGEWIWSKAAFGEFAGPQAYVDAYQNDLRNVCRDADCSLSDLHAVREEATLSFIETCVNTIDWQQFGLIGFSVVFMQSLASLALARALKERFPDIPIIMGGSFFEEDIADEIMRHCPQVDYIHCGDGDVTFPRMVRRLYANESMDGLPGLTWRDGTSIKNEGRSPNFEDLDVTPVPDFDEFFHSREESGAVAYHDHHEVMLPIETARGCWWGMKKQCIFCGLNQAGIVYRKRTVERTIEMLKHLSAKHDIRHFYATDNNMPRSYEKDLFHELGEKRTDLRIHYNIRPDLSHERLGSLRKGGLFSIQPGIESLSSHSLQLMNKPTTSMKNLELIKWATYYGINNLYNILTHVPGETREDYDQQTELVSLIHHLQPPTSIAIARADRGSPMYLNPESYGLRLVPRACYAHLFPPRVFDLRRVSYFFDQELDSPLPEEVYRGLYQGVEDWKAAWQTENRPYLGYEKRLDRIHIYDGRWGHPITHIYTDLKADLYEHCGDACSHSSLRAQFAETMDDLDETLALFIEHKLMVLLDDKYLSLAVPINPYH